MAKQLMMKKALFVALAAATALATILVAKSSAFPTTRSGGSSVASPSCQTPPC
ncbi:MAG: hypothetical protein JO353_00665 [Phycisphaerae bacterium]|nr:hypothetical protein [Phycisphaerae bacterium]